MRPFTIRALKSLDAELSKIYIPGTIAWIDSNECSRFGEAIRNRNATLMRADEFGDDALIEKTIHRFYVFVRECCERFDAHTKLASFKEFSKGIRR